jgi:nitrite reductase/ring-hydroxylating ferredoxin subunit
MALRVRVCRIDDAVAGLLRGFAVPGVDWPVMITRLGDVVVATSSVCPHEDVSLLDGDLDDGVVTCPGHSYELDLVTGRCKHDPSLRLRKYPVTIIDDEVWIDLVAPG